MMLRTLTLLCACSSLLLLLACSESKRIIYLPCFGAMHS